MAPGALFGLRNCKESPAAVSLGLSLANDEPLSAVLFAAELFRAILARSSNAYLVLVAIQLVDGKERLPLVWARLITSTVSVIAVS